MRETRETREIPALLFYLYGAEFDVPVTRSAEQLARMAHAWLRHGHSLWLVLKNEEPIFADTGEAKGFQLDTYPFQREPQVCLYHFVRRRTRQ